MDDSDRNKIQQSPGAAAARGADRGSGVDAARPAAQLSAAAQPEAAAPLTWHAPKKQRRGKSKILRALLLTLYWLLQWTWGIVQNIAGLVMFVAAGRGKARGYHGAAVRNWNLSGSMTLGMFILMDRGHGDDILAHEWGHTIQSIILGPLYLLAVGLPSIIWAGLPAFDRYRSTRHVPYDRLYCEGWATRLGRRTIKK